MASRLPSVFSAEFPVPALSASSLRSAPGGVVAATEQPFMVAQALSPCDAQGTARPLTLGRVVQPCTRPESIFISAQGLPSVYYTPFLTVDSLRWLVLFLFY